MSNISKKEIIVLGIIRYKDKFLVGKVREDRKDDYFGLEYVFPGGTVEEGESLENAATREIEEETGLMLDIKGEISSRVHPVTGKKTHYFSFISESDKVEIISGMNDDIDEYKWCTPDEIFRLMPTINPDVRELIVSVAS